MNEFLNEKVNIIVATKSGGGTGATCSSGSFSTVTNNTISIRGTLKTIEENFIILEDVELVELPQYEKAVSVFGNSQQMGPLSFNYKKTAINIDNVVTISVV